MSAVEGRLRAALAARALAVTSGDLQPALPPTAMPARRRFTASRWRLGLLLIGVASALVVAGFVVWMPRAEPGVPNAPAATVPASPETPTRPVGPEPSPTRSELYAPKGTPSTTGPQEQGPGPAPTPTDSQGPGAGPPPTPTGSQGSGAGPLPTPPPEFG